MRGVVTEATAATVRREDADTNDIMINIKLQKNRCLSRTKRWFSPNLMMRFLCKIILLSFS